MVRHMNDTLSPHIACIIENAVERLEWLIYKNYSGRGMYNQFCFGIVHPCNNDGQMLLELLQEVRAFSSGDTCPVLEVLDVITTMTGMRHDSLGKQFITYWPTLMWPTEQDTQDEIEE